MMSLMLLSASNNTLTLSISGKRDFSGERWFLSADNFFIKYGVDLYEMADSIAVRECNDGLDFVFYSQEAIFKIFAIALTMLKYHNYSRDDCVSGMLRAYESLTEEESDRCNLFLVSLLEKLNIKLDNNKPAFIIFLRYEYGKGSFPLADVVSDTLCQKSFVIDALLPLIYPPLIRACEESSLAVVKTIIKESPNEVNQCYSIDKDLSLLIDKYIKAYREKVTAIHAAAMRGDVAILHALLKHGASVSLKNSLNQTPLHVVKNSACLDLLIEYGADIHAVDDYGRTALHLACYNADAPLVAAGSRALSEMAENNRAKIRSLIKAGARVNQEDWSGDTPLHYAVKAFFDKSFANTLYSASVVAILCENGANPNVFNRPTFDLSGSGVPPLLYLYEDRQFDSYDFNMSYAYKAPEDFIVAANNALMIADLLLQYGADATACSSKGYTILHMLAGIRDFVALRYFLDFPAVKALINDQKSENRETPFHYAIKRRSSQIILDLLLDHGADLSLKCFYEGKEVTVDQLKERAGIPLCEALLRMAAGQSEREAERKKNISALAVNQHSLWYQRALEGTQFQAQDDRHIKRHHP